MFYKYIVRYVKRLFGKQIGYFVVDKEVINKIALEIKGIIDDNFSKRKTIHSLEDIDQVAYNLVMSYIEENNLERRVTDENTSKGPILEGYIEKDMKNGFSDIDDFLNGLYYFNPETKKISLYVKEVKKTS